MSNIPKLRTHGKRVFEQPKPRLTLVPPANDPADSVAQVELSVEVKEMLRDMQQQRRRRRDGVDEPDAA